MRRSPIPRSSSRPAAPWAALALLVLAACVPTARRPTAGTSTASDVETRIVRVAGGLARPVRVAGRPPDRLDLRERMAWYRVPGVAVAVVDDGRVVWERGYGVLEAGSERPVTPDTLFQAASISKPLVAVAVLRLVAADRLELDAPVDRWLERWKVPESEVAPTSEVTLRRLLSHSGGFTNGAVGVYPPGAPRPTLLEALDGTPPSTEPPARVEYPPGSRFVYSGAGYDVVQQALVDVEDEPLAGTMEQLVLRPAGMERSTFEQPLPAALAADAARGHDGSGRPLPGGWMVLPEAAAGGLWATAGDLGRFLAALAGSWREGGLLPTELAREMGRPQSGSWGLGIEVADDGGELRLEHTGSNPGYRAIAVLYPERGQGAVVLTNGDGGDALRGEILRAVAREYRWPGYGVEEVVAVSLTAASLDDVLGVYDYGGGYRTTLYREGERLLSRLGDGLPVEVVPVAGDELVSLQGTRYLLRRGEAGRVVGLTARLGRGEIPATKVVDTP